MTSGIVVEGAANDRRTDSNLAYCPQRLTICSLTCLHSRPPLAGSYLRVPVGRNMWLTKAVLVEKLVYPEIELRVLRASRRQIRSDGCGCPRRLRLCSGHASKVPREG